MFTNPCPSFCGWIEPPRWLMAGCDLEDVVNELLKVGGDPDVGKYEKKKK